MIRCEDITALLNNIATALGKSDAKAISKVWTVPSLVLSDQGAIAVKEQAEVETFFTHSIKSYNESGIIAARAELEYVESLSDKIVAVDVRWPGLDKDGREISSERSHYILQQDEHGKLYIRVALSRVSDRKHPS